MRIRPSRLSSSAVPSASVTSTMNGSGSATEAIRPDGTRSAAPAGGLKLKHPARHGHVAAARLKLGAVGADEPVLGGAHGQLAGVPHSPQNFAPFNELPQFPQNFFAACAAASGWPHPWQNFPPPLSCPQDGHRPVAWSR